MSRDSIAQTDTVIECYRRMLRIRLFEERGLELYRAGQLPGLLHLSVGQEAVAVGMTYFLEQNDMMFSTHRGHGHVIAKGGNMAGMFAELFGKESGLCKGRGGSMHMVDPSIGLLGTNGVVAGGIPIAVGAALGAQMLGDHRVTLSFFGDGAVANGAFHEALGLAGLWHLPVVFVCENNQYGLSTRFADVSPISSLLPRAASYGMQGAVVDGNDVAACLEVAAKAIDTARRGDGPTLIQADTYRWYGHNTADVAPYQSPEEKEIWRARDPLRRVREALDSKGPAVRKRLQGVDEAVATEVDLALEAARSGPEPTPEDALKYVWASDTEGGHR